MDPSHVIRLGWTCSFPRGFEPRHALLDTPEKVDLAVRAQSAFVHESQEACVKLARLCGLRIPAYAMAVAAPGYGEELTLP